ncbi:MAG TPA: glycosyltransferase family 2 protein [Rhodocyclaceae bacterium]|nr:glycosyltransferase family 2 protein [Rhodocyclaceae bacterium]
MGLLSVVIPVYNERENLHELHRQVTQILASLPHELELVLVDDGSRDGSTEIIRDLSLADPRVRGIRLSRNFGHEAAIEAGIREARGDAAIVMDADLQDAPGALPLLVAAWEEGADVAYAVRTKRKEGILLRAAFSAFYRMAGRVMSIDLPVDAGPFSLVSRPVIDVINAMPEFNRYFPGLRAFAGFRQVAVPVERAERLAGETKYSVTARTSGALNAIVSFSKLPLRIVIPIGFITAGLSIVAGLFVLGSTLTGASLVAGWASTMIVVLLLAGIQLITLGIIGEYVGKVYDEVRRRPTFIVAERFDSRSTTDVPTEPTKGGRGFRE